MGWDENFVKVIEEFNVEDFTNTFCGKHHRISRRGGGVWTQGNFLLKKYKRNF